MTGRKPADAGPARGGLMERHAEACRKRDAAALGSEAYRAAAEEVARIEIAIAELEEPAPTDLPGTPSA